MSANQQQKEGSKKSTSIARRNSKHAKRTNTQNERKKSKTQFVSEAVGIEAWRKREGPTGGRKKEKERVRKIKDSATVLGYVCICEGMHACMIHECS